MPAVLLLYQPSYAVVLELPALVVVAVQQSVDRLGEDSRNVRVKLRIQADVLPCSTPKAGGSSQETRPAGSTVSSIRPNGHQSNSTSSSITIMSLYRMEGLVTASLSISLTSRV